MSGRRTGLLWPGLIAGALLIASMARPVMAEELFTFNDDASLVDAMAALSENLADDAARQDPCRLHVLSDLRGRTLFDDATFKSMHQALATSILGTDRVDGCAVYAHAVGQNDVTNFLEERRTSGDVGLALALTYYTLNESVTVFASLRDASGNLLGSSGRFDLPVVAKADTGSSAQADAGGTDAAKTEEKPSSQSALARETPAEPASPPSQDKATTTRQRTTADTLLPEATLRRQLAADAEIEQTPTNPFNLRRIQAGIPAAIKTMRVVDAGGQDTALMADLANNFLSTLVESSGGSVETNDVASNGGRQIRVTIDGQSTGDVEAIAIQAVNARTAFELILDNDADIVVTRQPISSADAARFTRAYGVNMRSRYAEHVVAIAANETGQLDCGIRYPQNDMLMSTEDHPTSQRVYVYANPSIPGTIRDQFIDFALSTEGQAVVADHAVDLRLQLSDAGYAAWRYQAAGQQEAELLDVLERFRGLIRTSQRVSSTFRFDFASADLVLDSRSEQDLENLIDLIKASGIDSRRILLFGFADSSGAAPFNVNLSRGRADAVATRLRLAGIPVPPRNVHGIGEDSPVACNLQQDGDRDELGARKNRRVEVWIES